MVSNISQNNENSSQEKKDVVIPPEQTKQPEIPATFDSPALFAKEEEKKRVPIEGYPKVKNHTKLLFIIGGIILFIVFGIFSIVQISIGTKYQNSPIVPGEEGGVFSSLDDLLNGNGGEGEEIISQCGNAPFVRVISPDQNQVFKIGDTIDFRIEVCGIGPSLFKKANLEYYEKDTGTKVGEFSLECVATLRGFQEGVQTLSWTIPPFLEISENKPGCFLPVVNFLKPYTYQLSVEYAEGLYKNTGDMFLIDGTEYVYEPPKFSDYPVTEVTSFDRSFFIDSSAPQFLKDVISPIYFQAPPMFANYYRWYVIPKGPAFLIDLRDGKVYQSPQTTTRVFTRPESSLYISENLLETPVPISGQTHKVLWFDFIEETKSFKSVIERFCHVTPGASFNTYTDCIPTQ